MASIPIPPETAAVTLPGTIPPAPAVMAILNRFNRDELGNAIEVLVALLDIWDGNADDEDGGDDELAGDERDAAYIEWTTKPANLRRNGQQELLAGHEDDEQDDPGEDDDAPEDDDPGGCEHDGREPDNDEEREQMTDDVPVLRVYSAEHNIFNDQRAFLGFSNLQSSYRTNGSEVRSADTGAALVTNAFSELRKPGAPV